MTKGILNDSFNVTINFKWLIQIIIVTAMVVIGWYRLETRIQNLERNMELALKEIELHEIERKNNQKEHVEEIEERLLWYEQELNLNPFSWGKDRIKING